MNPTDDHAQRESADLRGQKDATALARYERLAGRLRCDECGAIATTVRIDRSGQRTSFSGTCLDHTPTHKPTTADRRVALALAERAITKETN